MGDGEREQVELRSLPELRGWLERNHQRAAAVWLVTWKKQPGAPYIPYSEIVDELICFGWIDSTPRKLDDRRTMRLIAPRRPGSGWSTVNREKVERLLAEGRMHSAGLARVEEAKADGSWMALAAVDDLLIPDDLAAELDRLPDARRRFEAFPPSSRRAILEWIHNAKQPATRERRVRETAEKAALNLKANHPAGRDRGPSD